MGARAGGRGVRRGQGAMGTKLGWWGTCIVVLCTYTRRENSTDLLDRCMNRDGALSCPPLLGARR